MNRLVYLSAFLAGVAACAAAASTNSKLDGSSR